MYVIVVYDVSVSRVSKVCNFLRRYLNWVQNSVFEGELTKSEFMRVESGLSEIIDKNEDSITFYILNSERFLERKFIGVRKSEPASII